MGILSLIVCGALPGLAVKEANDADNVIKAYNKKMIKFNEDLRKQGEMAVRSAGFEPDFYEDECYQLNTKDYIKITIFLMPLIIVLGFILWMCIIDPFYRMVAFQWIWDSIINWIEWIAIVLGIILGISGLSLL